MAALAPAFAQMRAADPARELAQAVKAYNQATIENDVATLDGLVTDDYMLVNSDTSVQDKQSYLADFKVPGFRIEPYAVEQPFQRTWGDTALTGGLQHLVWTQEGRRQSRWLRVAHVWIRHEGRWRIAYTQLTRVPEEQQ
jgi:ketosteroid isomerase-like protein